jgi:hypothetical protein
MNEDSYPELSVCLTIRSSDLQPEAVTTQLGLQPTRTWKAGEKRGSTRVVERDSGWILRTPARPALEFDDLVSEVLNEIEPRASELLELAKQPGMTVRLDCVGYVTATVPSIYFENGLLRRMGALGVDLDVDLFLTSAHVDTPPEA